MQNLILTILVLIALVMAIRLLIISTKKPNQTFVYYENNTKVMCTTFGSYKHDLKGSEWLYIGRFNGSKEDSEQIRQLLQRQKEDFNKYIQNSSHL